MPETPFNPEGHDPRFTGHEIPDEDAVEGASNEALLALQMKERTEALPEATRNELERVAEAYVAVSRHNLQWNEAWPDLLTEADHVRAEVMDIYHQYQRGEADHEAVLLAATAGLDKIKNIRAMMDPDTNPNPNVETGV